MWIVIIIIVVIILWFILSYTVDTKITKLKKKADHIFEKKYGRKIEYNVYETKDYSRTINKNIYLVLKDVDGYYYDDDTLLSVLIHELTHVECPRYKKDIDKGEKYHSEEFYEVENDLIEIGKDLNYFKKYDTEGVKTDDRYPCRE